METAYVEKAIEWVGKLTVAGTFAAVIVAFLKGWLVTGREHNEAVARLTAQVASERSEKSEWRAIALSGTRLANVAVRQLDAVGRAAPAEPEVAPAVPAAPGATPPAVAGQGPR